MELKIEYIPIEKLKPYERNARKHDKKSVDNIAKSIEKYGMNDPIGIWSDKNIVVEGHGRLLALKQLGYTEVPVVRLDHLSDKERREYAIAHNATTDLSKWDKILEEEKSDLDLDEFDFFKNEKDNPYSDKTIIPQYSVKLQEVSIEDLYSDKKTCELISEIEKSGLDEREKRFLIFAAYRHTVFNYKKIAEYYAQSGKEMQGLMEKSALVIIDYNDALANG